MSDVIGIIVAGQLTKQQITLEVPAHPIRTERWKGDPLWSEHYEVRLRVGADDQPTLIARLFQTGSYNGNFQVSLNPLRWLGPIAPDLHDPRWHDFIGNQSLMDTLRQLAHRVDYILHYRAESKTNERIHAGDSNGICPGVPVPR